MSQTHHHDAMTAAGSGDPERTTEIPAQPTRPVWFGQPDTHSGQAGASGQPTPTGYPAPSGYPAPGHAGYPAPGHAGYPAAGQPGYPAYGSHHSPRLGRPLPLLRGTGQCLPSRPGPAGGPS
jgi:hypothetical protein